MHLKCTKLINIKQCCKIVFLCMDLFLLYIISLRRIFGISGYDICSDRNAFGLGYRSFFVEFQIIRIWDSDSVLQNYWNKKSKRKGL